MKQKTLVFGHRRQGSEQLIRRHKKTMAGILDPLNKTNASVFRDTFKVPEDTRPSKNVSANYTRKLEPSSRLELNLTAPHWFVETKSMPYLHKKQSTVN
jgi:hypothetical protein